VAELLGAVHDDKTESVAFFNCSHNSANRQAYAEIADCCQEQSIALLDVIGRANSTDNLLCVDRAIENVVTNSHDRHVTISPSLLSREDLSICRPIVVGDQHSLAFMEKQSGRTLHQPGRPIRE